MKALLGVILATALMVSPSARATICFPPDPQAIYSDSDIVVLAFPKAISTLPRDAARAGFRYPFRQTILWQVHVSWKGPYKPGDTFTTRTRFADGEGCSSPIYRQGSLLLYLGGREPYRLGRAYYPENSIEQFKYLEGLRREP